eukprot:scaffold47566_cov57-Phaeocystis_antarctica.AAC.4
MRLTSYLIYHPDQFHAKASSLFKGLKPSGARCMQPRNTLLKRPLPRQRHQRGRLTTSQPIGAK